MLTILHNNICRDKYNTYTHTFKHSAAISSPTPIPWNRFPCKYNNVLIWVLFSVAGLSLNWKHWCTTCLRNSGLLYTVKLPINILCNFASLVPRPRLAFRRLQYGNSDGKLGGAWERGYNFAILHQALWLSPLFCKQDFPQYTMGITVCKLTLTFPCTPSLFCSSPHTWWWLAHAAASTHMCGVQRNLNLTVERATTPNKMLRKRL